MQKKRIKYLIGFSLIILVVAYLMMTSFRSALQYYVTVSELNANLSQYKDKILKVAGVAQAVSTEEVDGATVYRFQVEEGGALLQVSYKGLIPDTFRERADVVVTGRLAPDGTFVASEILAKCASKYEEKIK